MRRFSFLLAVAAGAACLMLARPAPAQTPARAVYRSYYYAPYYGSYTPAYGLYSTPGQAQPGATTTYYYGAEPYSAGPVVTYYWGGNLYAPNVLPMSAQDPMLGSGPPGNDEPYSARTGR
jgi:hypothetical protein